MTDIPSALQRRSRLLSALVALVFALLIFALGIELFAVARGKIADPSYLLYRAPMLFYLWAIWTIRRAILAVGAGRSGEGVVARLLTSVGIALFLGGIFAVFGTPLLSRLLTGEGAFAHYDVGAITLGVVGLALVLVAYLLHGAAEMRRELDEII